MFAFINNCHEAQITVYTDEEQRQWQETSAVIHQIEERLRTENRDWASRMAAWEESVRNDQSEWVVIRPELDTSGGQKHFVLEDGSILAAGYTPSQVTSEFTIDAPLAKITAIRLELLNDVSLPHGGPGRSIYGLCALTEFKASAAPLDEPDKQTDLKFSSATADVNPPEVELEKIFDDGSGKRRVTGPIEYANDGNDLTAWGIDLGPGVRARQAAGKQSGRAAEVQTRANARPAVHDRHVHQQHGPVSAVGHFGGECLGRSATERRPFPTAGAARRKDSGTGRSRVQLLADDSPRMAGRQPADRRSVAGRAIVLTLA
jgi:hypothetical protein